MSRMTRVVGGSGVRSTSLVFPKVRHLDCVSPAGALTWADGLRQTSNTTLIRSRGGSPRTYMHSFHAFLSEGQLFLRALRSRQGKLPSLCMWVMIDQRWFHLVLLASRRNGECSGITWKDLVGGFVQKNKQFVGQIWARWWWVNIFQTLPPPPSFYISGIVHNKCFKPQLVVVYIWKCVSFFLFCKIWWQVMLGWWMGTPKTQDFYSFHMIATLLHNVIFP